MDRDISPEERLLRIIKRRPKKKEEKTAHAEKVEPKPTKEPKPAREIEPAAILPRFKNIIIVNKALVSIFIVLIVYFLIDYFFLPAVKTSPPPAEELLMDEFIKREPVKYPYSYYQKEIAGKDVFKPLLRDVPEEEAEPDTVLEDIVTNLSLLGIVSGANPQAIIQDNKNKKTYFLNKGDKLGDVKLKEILEEEGRVTMIYKDREFDLVL